MVSIGYTIMGEQAGPRQLVADAVRGEAAGFDFSRRVTISRRGSMSRVTRPTRGPC